MTWFTTCSFTFLHICLVSSKAILFPPMNLTVNLLDFMGTAEWIPGPGNPPGTRYTVEYIPVKSISGGKWNRSQTCSDIATLKCDLPFDQQSEELFWNYFVRVKTTFKGRSSNWTTMSKSFQPYGDTRLSSPDVNILTERHNISISFSHRLELNQGTKPLEFLICLFEKDSVGSNSKVLALASPSKSPHIFLDVPPGKNYCVNVSASHQAWHQNNFNATKCFFLPDSPISHSGVIVFIVAMVAIAVGVTLTSMYFYQKRFKIEDISIPGALFVFAGTKMLLNFHPENINVISLMRLNAVTNTEYASASAENDYLLYHPRDCTNKIINPSSVVKREPAVHLPDPVEEVESLNQHFSDFGYTEMEESEENVISKEDDCNVHFGDTAAFISTSDHSLFAESETPQLHSVSIKLDRDAEEIESWCDEEDDVSFCNDSCDDSFSNGDYESRVNPRVF